LPREDLYYTGSQLQESILNFSSRTEEEKLALKTHMKAIVATQCDAQKINEQIRHTIEDAGLI
jgi:phosphoribosylaminoimidazole-succinocarboxamide synthase